MSDSKLDIKKFLDQDENKDLMRLLTAGSVDDGKSTLIGRLLFDSKKVYEDQLDALERDSKRMGHAGEFTDYALLLDGLKAEREQGITIDVAYRYFSTNKRKFIIADTPGHEQYTRNMATGGSTANLAIILIDATKGVITQTKRHTFITSLLGIKHVVLAVNKMDLVGYSEEVFDEICLDYRKFISKINIPDVHFIPLSALHGDNVVDKTDKMSWYHGKSLLEFLETVHVAADRNFDDFRFSVQYVLKPNNTFRGFSGKVASGIIRKGDEVMALPSKKTSRIKDIVTYDGELEEAFPPQSVTITLEDEIDISRGDMIVKPDNTPKIQRQFEAMMVWMDEKPMDPHAQYILKHNTRSTRARVDQILYKTDVNTLEQEQVEYFQLNEIGRVVFTTVKPLFFDTYGRNSQAGSFILIDPVTYNTIAMGMMIDKLHQESMPTRITDMDSSRSYDDFISEEEYTNRYRQKGHTIWITGLQGSGKGDLAHAVKRELFNRGATTVMLEGGSVRSGLSHELDYSPADRAEHLRRVAHVCKMLNNQGIITVCSFISPLESIRKQVAEIIDPKKFHMIYMDVDMEFCKNRVPEFYKKAEEQNITHIPGIDLSFDVPSNPVMTMVAEPIEDQMEKVLEYLERNGIFPV
jgi:adenylyl-sulfate kinase